MRELIFWAEVEVEKITHRKKNDPRVFFKMTCVADTVEWSYALSVLCGYFKIPEYFSLAFSQFISKSLLITLFDLILSLIQLAKVEL